MNETLPRHILVVDDDVMTSCTLKEHLEGMGFRITLAEGLGQAKQILGAPDRIDLLILDQLLKDGSGTDLLQTMALEETLQRPAVIMSSCVADANNPDWELLVKRLHATAQTQIKAYVNKPYSLIMMDAMIRLILSTSAPVPTPVPTMAHPSAPEEPPAQQVLTGDYQLVTPLYPYSEEKTKNPL